MRVISLVTTFAALAAVLAATAAGRGDPSCRTFLQASQDGALPATYAALHGGALPNASVECLLPRQ